MKKNRFFMSLCACSFLWAACNSNDGDQERGDAPPPPAVKEPSMEGTRVFIKGDFNGDSKKEEAWVQAPEGVNSEEMTCADSSCTATIRFSDPSIPSIPVAMCIGGAPDNLGPLYGDGRDVLGLLPSWFTSCWHGYYAWSLRNGAWKPALDTISTHCIQWESPSWPPVRPLPNRPGWARVHYSESTDTAIVIRQKDVRLRTE
ncbi:MAG: hypothetical protein EOO15_04395 [Chitinophagaceae bacterium]|nr:MAG: hypothetical protein EOO15_04395 [Chitinophagaceae bacterium]